MIWQPVIWAQKEAPKGKRKKEKRPKVNKMSEDATIQSESQVGSNKIEFSPVVRAATPKRLTSKVSKNGDGGKKENVVSPHAVSQFTTPKTKQA